MALILRPDDDDDPRRSLELLLPAADQFSLAELQDIVGGHIELMRTPQMVEGTEKLWLVDNEDGKGRGLPYNHTATAIYHLGGGPIDDVLVGTVVFARQHELGLRADAEDA